MQLLQSLSLACIWIFAAMVIIGLYKPWVVFWWADYAHRKRVLLTYGSLLLVSLLAYIVLNKLT